MTVQSRITVTSNDSSGPQTIAVTIPGTPNVGQTLRTTLSSIQFSAYLGLAVPIITAYPGIPFTNGSPTSPFSVTGCTTPSTVLQQCRKPLSQRQFHPHRTNFCRAHVDLTNYMPLSVSNTGGSTNQNLVFSPTSLTFTDFTPQTIQLQNYYPVTLTDLAFT